jgi:hypothetical protein
MRTLFVKRQTTQVQSRGATQAMEQALSFSGEIGARLRPQGLFK